MQILWEWEHLKPMFSPCFCPRSSSCPWAYFERDIPCARFPWYRPESKIMSSLYIIYESLDFDFWNCAWMIYSLEIDPNFLTVLFFCIISSSLSFRFLIHSLYHRNSQSHNNGLSANEIKLNNENSVKWNMVLVNRKLEIWLYSASLCLSDWLGFR